MKNNSNDSGASKLLCYLGIFILLLFIILPPLFRVLFPVEEEIEEEKEKTIVMNLTCEKTEDFVEYKLKTTINSNYADSMITDSVFKYEIEIVDSIMDSDAIEIEEYENLKKINNVDFEEEEDLTEENEATKEDLDYYRDYPERYTYNQIMTEKNKKGLSK